MSAKFHYRHPDQADAAALAAATVDRVLAIDETRSAERNRFGGYDLREGSRPALRVYLDDNTIVLHGLDDFAFTATFSEFAPPDALAAFVDNAL